MYAKINKEEVTGISLETCSDSCFELLQMSHEEDHIPTSGGSKESPAFGHTPFSPLRSLASVRPGYVTNRHCPLPPLMSSTLANIDPISEYTGQAPASRKVLNGIGGAWLGWLQNRAAVRGLAGSDIRRFSPPSWSYLLFTSGRRSLQHIVAC
jgi:hypothetical protein